MQGGLRGIAPAVDHGFGGVRRVVHDNAAAVALGRGVHLRLICLGAHPRHPVEVAVESGFIGTEEVGKRGTVSAHVCNHVPAHRSVPVSTVIVELVGNCPEQTVSVSQ
jgi:hypothetical protein